MNLRLLTCLMLALSIPTAFAQPKVVPPGSAANTTVLPLWNNQSGQVDGLLLIEPTLLPTLPSQRLVRPSASNAGKGLGLRAGLSIEANPGMGVLCNNGSVITSVGSMAGHCMLVNLGNSGVSPVPATGRRPRISSP